ncbi:hypothetical protein GCM10008940_05630 [Microbulbifer agarilyticus]
MAGIAQQSERTGKPTADGLNDCEQKGDYKPPDKGLQAAATMMVVGMIVHA